MSKKSHSILWLFLACTFLIGHSVIPHHHHEISSGLVSNHTTEHHHCDQNDIDPDQVYFRFVLSNKVGVIKKSTFSHLFFKDIHPIAGYVCSPVYLDELCSYSFAYSGQLIKADFSAYVPFTGLRGPPA